jgi:23S rRNA (pseudouridine1915-N3)-methyltransferase
MKVAVVAVGKIKGPFAEPVLDYEERARRYWKLTVTEVAAGAPGTKPQAERVREAEAERILARLPEDLEIVALTRAGEGTGSRDLATYLAGLGTRSVPGVCFVIGGAYGLDERVLRRAKRRMALSELTLPHEMARLVLAEQLYRAGTIVRDEPYHKG